MTVRDKIEARIYELEGMAVGVRLAEFNRKMAQIGELRKVMRWMDEAEKPKPYSPSKVYRSTRPDPSCRPPRFTEFPDSPETTRMFVSAARGGHVHVWRSRSDDSYSQWMECECGATRDV